MSDSLFTVRLILLIVSALDLLSPLMLLLRFECLCVCVCSDAVISTNCYLSSFFFLLLHSPAVPPFALTLNQSLLSTDSKVRKKERKLWGKIHNSPNCSDAVGREIGSHAEKSPSCTNDHTRALIRT